MRPTSIEDVDRALAECAHRLRLARETRNREARIVYMAQLNHLLDWRIELKIEAHTGRPR